MWGLYRIGLAWFEDFVKVGSRKSPHDLKNWSCADFLYIYSPIMVHYELRAESNAEFKEKISAGHFELMEDQYNHIWILDFRHFLMWGFWMGCLSLFGFEILFPLSPLSFLDWRLQLTDLFSKRFLLRSLSFFPLSFRYHHLVSVPSRWGSIIAVWWVYFVYVLGGGIRWTVIRISWA